MDWMKNIEICELVTRDPGQARDAIKAIKKRVGSDDEENDGTKESEEEGEKEVSENELYEQVKQRRDAKRAAKTQLYPRTSVAAAPSRTEAETVGGKRRPIGGQIAKNRGLTRPRPKDKKNPRTNNRRKHEQSIKCRLGQVRDVKKPSGPYGGETSGINACVSRSIRFKS